MSNVLFQLQFGYLCAFLILCIVPAYRFNEFGVDGGPAAKSLEPKFHIFSKHVLSHTGVQVPDVEVRYAQTFFNLVI